MVKEIAPIVCFCLLFLLFGCGIRSDYIYSWRNNGDEYVYYKNLDHDFEIHLPNYWTWKGNGRRLRKHLIYHNRLKLQKAYPNYIELLQYSEGLIETKSAFFAELYSEVPRLSDIVDFVKKQNGTNLEIIDSTTNYVYYEKKIKNYSFRIVDRFKNVGDKAIRLVFFIKNPFPLLKNEPETNVTAASDRKRLERYIGFVHDYTEDPTDSLAFGNHKESIFKMFMHFRDYYQFDYAKLNLTLDKILDSEEEYSSEGVGTLLSFLSRNKDILTEYLKKNMFKDSLNVILKDHSKITMASFLDQNELPQILVLNESHLWSQCRWQLTKILPRLKEKGYSSMFIETLVNFGNPPSSDISFNQHMGGYTSDPTFGNLCRSANNLGFMLYPYEIDFSKDKPQKGESRFEMRERVQSENIIRAIKNDSLLHGGKKIVIYCGLGHANEVGFKSKGKLKRTLARLLKDSLKIDPVTINQSELIGREKEVSKLIGLDQGQSETYLISSPKISSSGYDYFLVEDNTNYFENYPSYIYNVGNIPWKFKCKNLTLEEKHLLWVEPNIHDDPQLPLFVAPYRKSRPTLHLPKGAHRIFVFDKDALVCDEIFIVK